MLAAVDEVAKYRRCSESDAKVWLDDKLASCLNNALGKWSDRPWEIVDFRKKLDTNEPWIGFEFETGFDSKKEYQQFVNFLWKNIDYVAMDREGTGDYPIELAFAPMEMSKVQAGNSTLLQTVKFIHEAKLTPALNPTTYTRRDVGIHAGISTPKWNKLKGDAKHEVGRRMAALLSNLTDNQKTELYGRHKLYWGTANVRAKYIELKQFKAIPTVEHVETVVRVTCQCVKLLDMLIDDPNLTPTQEQVYKFLSSTDDTF